MPRFTNCLRHDRVAADLAVHPRPVLDRLDGRARDEREVGQVDAVVLLVLGLAASGGCSRPSSGRPRTRVVTCAEVSSERRMCSATPRRIALIGSIDLACRGRRTRRRRAGAGGGAAERQARRRPRASVAAAGAGAAPRGAESMSFFVTRPPRPVPWHRDGVDAVLGRDPRDDGRDEGLAVRRETAPRLGAWLAAHGAPGVRGSRLAARPVGRRAAAQRARRAGSRRAIRREHRADVDRLALLDEDLARRRRCPGSAPRCRPCRSRSRAASRRRRPCRPPA